MRGADFLTTKRARRLRADPTNAERKLWHRLRGRSINNSKFVRQEPIGRYFVDFVCREKRLIVEVDGGQHAGSRRDAARDHWLAEEGYRVLRFWNNDVLTQIDAVLETINVALNSATFRRQELRGRLEGRPGVSLPLPACGERSAGISGCGPGEGESG